MYGSWGHYTEISKTQENIQYDMTHTQNPKKAKPIETVAVTKGKWGDAVKGYRLATRREIISGNLRHSRVITFHTLYYKRQGHSESRSPMSPPQKIAL